MRGFIFCLVFFWLYVSIHTESCDEKNLDKLAVANNDLGVNLYHRLTKNNYGNIFFSSLSLSTAFGMLFVGTGGNSAEQLRNALGYNAAQLSSNKVPFAFDQYINKILSGNGQNQDAYALNIANEILLSNRFDVYTDYKEEVQHYFHADVKEVDFSRNTNQILKKVNNWVSQQTNGKIDKLLSDLSPATLFLIINAVYFKGTWQTQFNTKLTSNQEFYNYGQEDEAKLVPFMHVYEKFPYYRNEYYQIIELPYKGKEISMLVLLPNAQDSLEEVEREFTAEDIKTFQNKLRPTTLNLALPKFKLAYSREMSSDFSALGAKDIFDSRLADFSGLTQSKGLFVNQVIHKAALEVNEKGSEAAAATVIGGFRLTPYPAFVANHPFMLMILDKRNSLVLFMGRVTNL